MGKKKLVVVLVFVVLVVLLFVVLIVGTVVINHLSRKLDKRVEEFENYLEQQVSEEQQKESEAVEKEEKYGTGEMYVVTGSDTPRFINEETFIESVPQDIRENLYEGLPVDLIEVYDDLEFVSYDADKGMIYAHSEKNGDYEFELTENSCIMRKMS